MQHSQPIVSPVMSEMFLNLSRERLRQRLVIGKPLEELHPIMESSAFVDNAHLLFVVGYNFDKAAKNVREKSDSTEHNDHGEYPFRGVYRIEVSVAYSRQGSQCVVAANYQFSEVGRIIKSILSEEIALCGGGF